MAKRRKTNSKKSSKILLNITWILAIIALSIGSFITGYYYGNNNAKNELIKKQVKEKEKRNSMLKKLEKASMEKTSVNNRLKEVLKKDSKYKSAASHEYTEAKQVKPPKRAARDIAVVSDKPKLAIIIDDVSTRSHVNAIKSLEVPMTMSFLPPSMARPNSAKLAAKEDFYMVHLPMEAMSFTAEEPFTLRVNDSQKTISKRIADLKKIFPRVTYINNHTGSKFTSNEAAMNRLIYAFNLNNIGFVDSRTTADTKVPKVMKNYGLRYFARDVFLDHENNKAYIKKQIRHAIKIAKKHGTAVAIGHPHANTILAINESKKLFKDVELVYINRLY